MLLTPLLSVSALAVPPLAQVTFPSSHNHLQSNHIYAATAPQPQQINQRPAADSNYHQRQQQQQRQIYDETHQSTVVRPPWPPPKTAPPALKAGVSSRRWNKPPTRNGNDSKTLNASPEPNYNIQYEPNARTPTTSDAVSTQRRVHRNQDVVSVSQQTGARNFVRANSSSVYSVKNRITSHVSHSISSNYSYVKDRNVFVSNGFDGQAHVYPKFVPKNAPPLIPNGVPTTSATTAGGNGAPQRNHMHILNGWSPNINADVDIENGERSADVNFTKQRTKLVVLIVAAALVLCGFILFILYGVVRCLRAARRASRALALPIPLLPEDQTPLNAEPDQPVPMLSVQAPGYAGMERLGVPARAPLSSPSEDRSPISRRMCVEGLQMVRENSMLAERQVRCCTNVGTGGTHTFVRANGSRCPHHVPLPDSEWGPDRNMHLRSQYQAEITRTYIKPPPNKTALDVPEHNSYNPPINHSHPYHQQRFGSNAGSTTASSTSPTTTKSKPNPITKFFQRISSTKSPPPPATTPAPSETGTTVAVPAPSPPLPSFGQQPPSYQQHQQQHYQQHMSLPSSNASSMHKIGLSGSISDSGSSASTQHTHSISTANLNTTPSGHHQSPAAVTSLSMTPPSSAPAAAGRASPKGGGGPSDQQSHHTV